MLVWNRFEIKALTKDIIIVILTGWLEGIRFIVCLGSL